LQRSGDLAETMSELGLLQVDGLAAVALGPAVLVHHHADQPPRNPETSAQDLNRLADPAAALLSATPFRAQKFLIAPKGLPVGATRFYRCAEDCGWRIAFLSFASASGFQSFGEAFGSSRGFSFSSWVSRLASSACIPPLVAASGGIPLRHLEDAADVGDGLDLCNQLLGGPLLRRSPSG
jgi:hypothetical protein